MDSIGTDLLNACFVNNIIIKNGTTLHLGIFNQPFYSYIISGEKTVESRFSINKCSPYGKVKKDDIVFVKESGKPISSYFIVDDAKYYSKEDNNFDLELLKRNYSRKICAFDNDFWQSKKNKNYASLIWIKEPQKVNQFSIEKKDKRGWVDYRLRYPKTLILISGKIGSGKTFWADKIAKEFNCNRNSFSDYLKLCCKKVGLEINRKNLQEMGQWAILNDFENFMNYTILNNFNSKNNYLIIDGLRHLECVEYFKTIIENVIHINIKTSENFRVANIIERDGEYSCTYDSNDIESNCGKLNECADYVVNEFSSEKEIFSSIKDLENHIKQLCLF